MAWPRLNAAWSPLRSRHQRKSPAGESERGSICPIGGEGSFLDTTWFDLECKNLNILFSQPKWINIDKWEIWESIYKWRGRQKYKNVTQQAFQSNNCKKKYLKKEKYCIESGHTVWSVYMYMYLFFGIHFKQIFFLFWLSFWFRRSQTTETNIVNIVTNKISFGK